VTTTNSLDIHKASSLVDDAEHGLCLFSPPGFKKAEGGLCVLLLFYLKIFLVISVTPVISTSTRPIFTKFARMVELWL